MFLERAGLTRKTAAFDSRKGSRSANLTGSIFCFLSLPGIDPPEGRSVAVEEEEGDKGEEEEEGSVSRAFVALPVLR